MSLSTSIRALRSMGRVVFGVAWTLVAAEAFLRCLCPSPVVPRYVTAGPHGIRVNEPNRTYTHRSADYRIEIHTNAQGMRSDHDIPYEKPSGVRRIVILGDSFGMGYEVSYQDMFTTRLERELRDAGKQVEVVNLSVSGYGNAEELIMLREEGLKYHPDVVLVCWHPTDLDDNVRCDLFSLTGGSVLKPQADTYLPGVTFQQRLNRIPGYDWVQGNLDLYSFAREGLSYHVVKPLLVFLNSDSTPAAPKLLDTSDAAVQPVTASTLQPGVSSGTPQASEADRLTLALLREIRRLAASGGARTLIMDIPYHSENRVFHSHFPHPTSSENLSPDIRLDELFAAHWQEGAIYWTRSQGHFTPFGSRLVGHELASQILRRGLLD